MRINGGDDRCMFGFKKCSGCTDKIEDKDGLKDKFALKKMEIHRNYICIILGGIIIWLITSGTYTDNSFPELVSFASTISSIILSVIAIIMSITGESKTEAMKNQMEETAKRIDIVTNELHKDMDTANADITKLISQLEKQIKILQDKVDKVPEQVNQYKNTNKTYSNTKNKTIRNNGDWGIKNEKS